MSVVGVGAPPVLLEDDGKNRAEAFNGAEVDAGDAGTGDADAADEETSDGGACTAADDDDGAGTLAGTEGAGETEHQPTSRYLLVVNDCDVVPRLLGSPMPVGALAMLARMPQGGAIPPALLRRMLSADRM